MACLAACPVEAISVSFDKKGFYIPSVDNNKCINCGKCKRVCPSLNFEPKENTPEVFACWQKNDDIRAASTSGGMFFALAEYVIGKGGSVFGAAFDSNLVVEHTEITTFDDISRLQGSKYVQSRIGSVFKSVKERLDTDKYVLFTGTPCQVAGLKKYLGKTYEKLITVDLICHCAPSPGFFSDYLSHIKREHSVNITNIYFRNKKPSWTRFSMKIDFSDHPSYETSRMADPYLLAFLYDYISRDCCHKCKYTSVSRQGDITLGDFWGYVSEKRKFRNNEKGISLVLLNSNKGKHLFEQVKDDYICIKKDLSEAMAGNSCLYTPSSKNKNSDNFWADYFDGGYETVKTKYLYQRKPSLKHRLSTAIDDYTFLMPAALNKKYRSAKKKMKGDKA